MSLSRLLELLGWLSRVTVSPSLLDRISSDAFPFGQELLEWLTKQLALDADTLGGPDGNGVDVRGSSDNTRGELR